MHTRLSLFWDWGWRGRSLQLRVPRSHRPLPRRGTRQVQPEAVGKVRYKFPYWIGVAGSVRFWEGRTLLVPLQQLQRFPGVCGTGSLALGAGSRNVPELCLDARCASLFGCHQRGLTLGLAPQGRAGPQGRCAVPSRCRALAADGR